MYFCKKYNTTKTIFLDIDGILRTYQSDLEWSKKLNEPILKGTNRLFDPKCVEYLNEIVYLTGARIVITSNWRLRLTLDELKKALRERGVIGSIEGVTDLYPVKNSPIPLGNRGLEILRYIQDKNISKSNYIVIDDQVNDIINFVTFDRVHKVDSMKGLTSNDVDKIIEILL